MRHTGVLQSLWHRTVLRFLSRPSSLCSPLHTLETSLSQKLIQHYRIQSQCVKNPGIPSDSVENIFDYMYNFAPWLINIV